MITDDQFKAIDLSLKALGLVSVTVAAMQLRTARRTHVFDVFKEAMAMLDDKEVREARKWVYKMHRKQHVSEGWVDLPSDSEGKGSADSGHDLRVRHKQMAELTARTFDKLGLFVREGVLPLDLVARFYVTPVLRSWFKLSPYISLLRRERSQVGHFWEFENLVFDVILPGIREGRSPFVPGLSDHEGLSDFVVLPGEVDVTSNEIAARESRRNDGGVVEVYKVDLTSLRPPNTQDTRYRPPRNYWRLRTFNLLRR